MGFLQTLGSIAGSAIDAVGSFGASPLGAALIDRGIRKLATGSSGDPATRGGMIRQGLAAPRSLRELEGAFGLPMSAPRTSFSAHTGNGFPLSITGGTPMPALPGGAMPLTGALPSVLGGVLGGLLGEGAESLFEGGGSCPQLFGQARQTARARQLVMAMNPVTGNPTFFRHVGRPILFSGDLATCRRVNKVAARARRGRR